MPRFFAPAATVLAGLVLAGACSEASEAPVGVCAIAQIAITVTPRDSVSGAPLVAVVRGAVRNRATGEVDSLGQLTPLTLYAGRQLGVYDVMLEGMGYQPWARLGVVVNQTGSCGELKSAALIAKLQPLP